MIDSAIAAAQGIIGIFLSKIGQLNVKRDL